MRRENNQFDYVLGFAFDPHGQFVVLIRKQRPDWMAGKLNGVGGKVEVSDVSTVAAQRREFREETGLDIPEDAWELAGEFGGPWGRVAIFKTFRPNIWTVSTVTDEEVIVRSATALAARTARQMNGIMHNVPVLLALCLRKDLDYFSLTEK